MALILGTFGYCVVSGLLPVVNAELYFLSIAVLAPPELRLPLVLAATLGQMTATAKLNRRPRKRLGYRPPEECYAR